VPLEIRDTNQLAIGMDHLQLLYSELVQEKGMVISHFKCARGFVFVCIPHLSLTRRPVFRGSLRAG